MLSLVWVVFHGVIAATTRGKLYRQEAIRLRIFIVIANSTRETAAACAGTGQGTVDSARFVLLCCPLDLDREHPLGLPALSSAAFQATALLLRVSEGASPAADPPIHRQIQSQIHRSEVAVPVRARIFDGAAIFFHADAVRVRLQLIRFAGIGRAQQPLLVDRRGTLAVLGAAVE